MNTTQTYIKEQHMHLQLQTSSKHYGQLKTMWNSYNIFFMTNHILVCILFVTNNSKWCTGYMLKLLPKCNIMNISVES